MDRDFVILAAILAVIGSAGIYAGLISHPIMYITSAVIFAYLGYIIWQILGDPRVTRGRKEVR